MVEVANGVGAARQIVDHGKALAGHIAGIQPAQKEQIPGDFTVNALPQGTVNVPVLYTGTGYLTIRVDTTDASGNINEKIRTIMPVRGRWSAQLVFTKTGTYDVKFIMGSESIMKQISIVPCSTCGKTA